MNGLINEWMYQLMDRWIDEINEWMDELDMCFRY